MAGEVTVRLSQGDYFAANRDWFRLHMFSRRRLLRFGGLILIIGVLGALLGSLDGVDPLEEAMWLAALAAAGLLLCYGLGYVLMPRRTERIFNQQGTMRYTYTYSWSEAGLGYTSERATANLPWSDYFRWAEGRASFLFFLNEQIFYILPKHALSEAQADDLRATASAFGPKHS